MNTNHSLSSTLKEVQLQLKRQPLVLPVQVFDQEAMDPNFRIPNLSYLNLGMNDSVATPAQKTFRVRNEQLKNTLMKSALGIQQVRNTFQRRSKKFPTTSHQDNLTTKLSKSLVRVRNLTKEEKVKSGGGSPKSNFGGISSSMINLRKHRKGTVVTPRSSDLMKQIEESPRAIKRQKSEFKKGKFPKMKKGHILPQISLKHSKPLKMNRSSKLSSLIVRKRSEKGIYLRNPKNQKITFLQSSDSEKRFFPFDYFIKDTQREFQASKVQTVTQDSIGPFIKLYQEMFLTYKNQQQFFTPQELLAKGPFPIFSEKEISYLHRKKVLFIDLDETLVHCSYLREENIQDKEDPSIIKIENKDRTYYVSIYIY